MVFLFFFFNQKTAYGLRISDWSSDVCSSDLPVTGRDENTPAWVQHLAFKVGSYDELVAAKEHLTANGIDVLGPTHHGIFKSIYFFDPNGHRVEQIGRASCKERVCQYV